jgi:hypothetical protein
MNIRVAHPAVEYVDRHIFRLEFPSLKVVGSQRGGSVLGCITFNWDHGFSGVKVRIKYPCGADSSRTALGLKSERKGNRKICRGLGQTQLDQYEHSI